MSTIFSRRAALLAAAAVAASVLAACNTPQQAAVPVQPAGPAAAAIGAIPVDTSGLLAQSGDPTASWVQQALPRQLARYLGSRAPSGLSVQVNSIVLGPDGPGGGAIDTITGVANAGARQIPIRATTFYTPMSIDQALWEQALQGRVTTLSQAFAQTLARKLRH